MDFYSVELKVVKVGIFFTDEARTRKLTGSGIHSESET